MNKIGMEYSAQYKNKETLDYIYRALALSQKIQYLPGMASAHQNLGFYYAANAENKTDTSRIYFF